MRISPRVTLVTPTTPDRTSYLIALLAQAREEKWPFDEWIILGSSMPEGFEGPLVFVGAPAHLGVRHQMAWEMATGDVIICVDDDDWHHPLRIGKQVDELARHPLVGSTAMYCVNIAPGQPRQAIKSKTWDLRGRARAHKWIPGGSSAFWRRLALEVGTDELPQVGGWDSRFIERFNKKHPDTWDSSIRRSSCSGGTIRTSAGRAGACLIGMTRNGRSRSSGSMAISGRRSSSGTDEMSFPKISAVTTALPERLHFLRRLVAQAPWLRASDWIICGPSDGEQSLATFSREMGARYIESAENMGTCRNLCAGAAEGEIIIQVDDDDWQHPGRVAKQIAALTFGGSREVVGSSWLYCLHAKTETASRISFWDSKHCLPGATLAYWRSAWARHPFDNVQGEDGPFTAWFGAQGTCFDMHDPKLLVYMRHEAHLPNQRDWWRETRSQEQRISVHEKIRRRLENPSRSLNALRVDTPRDLALEHENEAATVYVRWLMGEKDFASFCAV